VNWTYDKPTVSGNYIVYRAHLHDYRVIPIRVRKRGLFVYDQSLAAHWGKGPYFGPLPEAPSVANAEPAGSTGVS